MDATSGQAIQCGVDVLEHMYIFCLNVSFFHLLQKRTSHPFAHDIFTYLEIFSLSELRKN